MERNGPKWGQEFFPINPDLADILGDTDFDSENLYFWDFVRYQIPRFLDFQIPGFPDSRQSAGMSRGQLARVLWTEKSLSSIVSIDV